MEEADNSKKKEPGTWMSFFGIRNCYCHYSYWCSYTGL